MGAAAGERPGGRGQRCRSTAGGLRGSARLPPRRHPTRVPVPVPVRRCLPVVLAAPGMLRLTCVLLLLLGRASPAAGKGLLAALSSPPASGRGGLRTAYLRRELLCLTGGGGGSLAGLASRDRGWRLLRAPPRHPRLYSPALRPCCAQWCGGVPGSQALPRPSAALLPPLLTQGRGSLGTRAASVPRYGSLTVLHSAKRGRKGRRQTRFG